jgi:VanZ family protein
MTGRRRRARRQEAPRRWAAVLLTICVCVIGAIVLTPGPPAAGAQDGLYEFFRRAHAAGLPSFIGFGLVEWLSNVVMFLPLGFLGLLATRRRRLVLPLLVLLSGAIELIQYAFLPDRVASLKDVLANSTGALLGVLLAVAWSRHRARLRRRSDSIRREWQSASRVG